MERTYIRKPGDRKVDERFPSGSIASESYMIGDQPANGWSRKTYDQNGRLKQEQCFSHSLLIEQVDYSQEGRIVSHKIYSHSRKELVEKPKAVQVIRPNVVSGCAHMGFYYRHLPAIAAFIEAEYDESSLEKAYQDFIADASSYEFTDEDYEEREYPWKLLGKKMNFGLWFEKSEMLYQWHLWAKDEEQYEEAKAFMEQLAR